MMYIKGIENIKATQDKLEKLKTVFGEEAKAHVELLTPTRTGRLKDHWDLKVEGKSITLTNTARNDAGDPYAVHVEFGTENMRGVFMLTRTVKAARRLLASAKRKVGL